MTAVLGTIPVFAGRLGAALTMQAQGFGPGAIGSTVLVGGLLTVLLLPLIGVLADRLGRRPVTMLAHGVSALGMLTLAGAVELWHFWVAMALLATLSSACGALTAALAADLLPGALLTRGFGSSSSSVLWVITQQSGVVQCVIAMRSIIVWNPN
jgi:MFS family permease